MFDLTGRVAIVTGGNGGIGLGMARGLAEAGAHIVVAARNAEKSSAAVSKLQALGAQALAVEIDVTLEQSVAAMVDAATTNFGGLDVLFNNAGTLRPGTAVELSVEDWDLVMGVNVRSVFLGAKYAVPAMERRGGGSIINTASVSGLHGDGGAVVYAASKAAVINLTRALSTDHAPAGIRVNAICPGTIETPPVQRMMQHPGTLQLNLDAHALGRLGRPDEIAAAAVWLASDQASFVTGEALVVDGGLHARSPLGRLVDPRPAHKR